MDAATVEEVTSVVAGMSRLSGLHVTWKWFTETESRSLPTSISNHNNPFCEAVKSIEGLSEQCKRDDIYRFTSGAPVPRTPFLKQCHAGITEILVPVYRGDDCVGMLYAGPTRPPRGSCPYGRARRAFRELPLLDRRVLGDVAAVLSFVARRLGGTVEPAMPAPPAGGPLEGRIAAAVRLIEQRLAEPLRAGEVARACALSPSRFTHVFTSALGIPFSSYLAQRRMSRARRLLVQSDLSVRDVGQACGYANQDYFSAAFSKAHGVSATHYRHRHAAKVLP